MQAASTDTPRRRRRIDLVVFDLGGVLVQAVQSWREAHQRAGLPGLPPSGPEFEARLAALPRRSTGAIDSERYFELFAEASAGVYSVADVRAIDAASLFGEYPGIDLIFDVLEAAAIDTAVLSDSNDAHWARLFPEVHRDAEFPTLLRARYRFGSHLLGVTKPDPRAYQQVERETVCRADRILFFDNAPANIRGANAVGWTAQLIDPAGDTATQILEWLQHYGFRT